MLGRREMVKDITEIQKEHELFLINSVNMNTSEQKKHVDLALENVLMLRDLTPEKFKVTTLLHNMLNDFSGLSSRSVSHITTARFTDSLYQAKNSQDIYYVPALLFPGYLGNTPYSLCGLDRNASYTLCDHLYRTLRMSGEISVSEISRNFDYIKDTLKAGLDDPISPIAHQRYQAFVVFLYQCFDNIPVSAQNRQNIEAELRQSAVFQPYLIAEHRKRAQRTIGRDALFTAINAYQTNSWVGWFWNVALRGVFGKHESYTVAALKRLYAQNTTATDFLEQDIRECLQSEPKHAQHRLAFFTQPQTAVAYYGTDKLLQKIDTGLTCGLSR